MGLLTTFSLGVALAMFLCSSVSVCSAAEIISADGAACDGHDA